MPSRQLSWLFQRQNSCSCEDCLNNEQSWPSSNSSCRLRSHWHRAWYWCVPLLASLCHCLYCIHSAALSPSGIDTLFQQHCLPLLARLYIYYISAARAVTELPGCCQPTLAARAVTDKLNSLEAAATSERKLHLLQSKIRSAISALKLPLELPSLAPAAHPPPVPRNVRCQEVDGVVTVEWDACDGRQMSYEVQCQDVGGLFKPVSRSSGCAAQVSVKGSVGGPRPQYRVRSLVWHSTAGEWCEPVKVTDTSYHHCCVHHRSCATPTRAA